MRNLAELKDFDAIRIYLASEADILGWSFGEITKPETINYRTFKAERDGLYDERIFGPTKDFMCYCGKYKGIRYKGVICDKCGVEVTRAHVRRERMGHINLASPVVHVWFFKGSPSKLAGLLNLSPKSLESVIYFSSFIVTEFDGAKKAAALSQVTLDLETQKKASEEEFAMQNSELTDKILELEKAEDSVANKEALLKAKQKLQALKQNQEKKLEELERGYELVQKKLEGIDLFTVISDNEYLKIGSYVDMFCKVEIGAEAVKGILEKCDLTEISKYLSEELTTSKGQKAQKIAKRLKIVEEFRRANLSPDRMVLRVLPVIPPDLRPMVQLDGGSFATSDLNDLYRRVINRNNRLKRLMDLGAPEIIVRNEKRMLQESVDALFDASKQRKTNAKAPVRGKKPLRSLADMLKGKTGRFRQNLLGKRVDYSGRGVIINGPDLKLDECGLPKEMALELFKPFVLRELMVRGFAPNIKSAKFVLEERGGAVWDILEDVVKGHPVLLNRAPTLWRLGIQAFYPKLIDGNAIRLHLCVCSGFNADFDGDQMAVHVPLSQAAIDEAVNLMLSSRNILKPSDGEFYSVPKSSILFGIYYLTIIDDLLPTYEKIISSADEAIYLNQLGVIKLRQTIKVRLNGEILETSAGRILFNKGLPSYIKFVNTTVFKKDVNKIINEVFTNDTIENTAKTIDALKDFGLKYGTISGLSVSLEDIIIPNNRDALIEKGRSAVEEIDMNYKMGFTTKEEAQRNKEKVWGEISEEIGNASWDALGAKNPVKVLVDSQSTRASKSIISQISGIKGLISDATGKVVELPILGNYKNGLSGQEYFVGGRSARKGLVDKGLKTADAGYLTRRLVDVSQDVLTREHDCGVTHGRVVKLTDKTMLAGFANRVAGRYLAKDVVLEKETIKAGTLLTEEIASRIEKSSLDSIEIRSPMYCQTRRGLCTTCYGTDVMTKATVKLGIAVGISAAQAIGEPGTQLTMKTFHTGGVAGVDITQGLPRIEELVEARTPKFLAVMSELTGTVKVLKNGDERKVLVMAQAKDGENSVAEYLIDPVAEILVKDGDIVTKGDKLTSGNLDLAELAKAVGIDLTKKYILEEVQRVYSSQGVRVSDVHIEVIVSQMFKHIRINDSGDTKYIGHSGEVVTLDSFLEENDKVLAEGKKPAEGSIAMLGITKAALYTDSFLSAASFIQTSNVLTDAAASGKVDLLYGLKENVILGRLIPTIDVEKNFAIKVASAKTEKESE